jgi:proliferating cell nuclear antigen
MINLVTDEPNKIKSIFTSIEEVVDEVIIEVDSDAWVLNALDRSHITFVKLLLTKDYFTEYSCPEPVKLAVDTKELLKVLKRGKSDDTLTLQADEGHLIIIFKNMDLRRTFKIKLIDLDYEPPQAPDLEWPSTVKLPFSTFKDAISDIEVMDNKVAMSVDEDKIYMDAEGDFGDAKFEYLHGEKIEKKVRSVFSLEKIKFMLKTDKFSDEVTLGLGVDMPLLLILNDVDENGFLRYMLAPRIEQEE